MKHLTLVIVAASLFSAAVSVMAAEPVVGTGIDANTFRPGHPASPTWRVVHANGEHPAVLQARLAQQAHIDPNTFLVQPPAATRWVSTPAAAATLALATAR